VERYFTNNDYDFFHYHFYDNDYFFHHFHNDDNNIHNNNPADDVHNVHDNHEYCTSDDIYHDLFFQYHDPFKSAHNANNNPPRIVNVNNNPRNHNKYHVSGEPNKHHHNIYIASRSRRDR
jgi:hypothetical protein